MTQAARNHLLINRTQLGQLMQSQIDAASLLLQTLDRERKAIAGRQLEALDAAVCDKQAANAALEALTHEVATVLGQAGIGITEHTGALLAASDPQLGKLWRYIQELGQQCKEENDLNGRIIAACQQQTMHALQLLTGRTPSSAVYSPDGKTAQAASTSLGEA